MKERIKGAIKTFKCSDCKQEQDHFVWNDKEKTGKKCINKNCKKILTLSEIVEPKPLPKAPGIRTPTKNRV